MRLTTIFSILAVATILLLGSPNVGAQNANVSQVTPIHVPFAFTVGNKQLPAGDYLIHRSAQNEAIVQITPKNSEHGTTVQATVPMYGNEPQLPGKLVFNSYGADLFLSELWLTGSSTGRQFRVSDAERELASRMAPERTEIALER